MAYLEMCLQFPLSGDFLAIFMLLISILISLWLGNMLCMISIISKLLRFALTAQPQGICSVLVCVPWAIEKDV